MILPENCATNLVQIFEEFGCVRQIWTFLKWMVRPETSCREADYFFKNSRFSNFFYEI
jgi:hypothetical protein